MKALLIALAAFACGAASAQQDAGAVCRSFCDTDAKQCRDGTAHPEAWAAASTLLFLHGAPAASPDKHEQARSDADRDRSAQSQQCGDARQVCRQKCSAPAAAPMAASAASATP
jgi:hypothetical protein